MIWLVRKVKFVGYLIVFFGSIGALLAVAGVASVLMLPDVSILEKCITTTMYQVHLCPGGANYARLKDISPYVLHAVIASEDGSFYTHKGFDWHEIKESMQRNLESGGFRRGGSTLTQQLAKNVFLDKEKSLWRKVKEAYLANAIENHFDKNMILEKYLNVVEFGQDLYGIKPAAQKYFRKAPSQLNPLEAAWLAMLLPNPKKYSQSYRAGKLTPYARKMVAVILKRMESFGKLTPAGYQTAMGSIDQFPWSGLSMSAFGGSGSYSLETNVPASAIPRDEPIDENALEEMIEEDSSLQERTRDPDSAAEPAPKRSRDSNGDTAPLTDDPAEAVPDDFE